MTTFDQARQNENDIADAEISNALDTDMMQVVLDYMVTMGLSAARLREALNDAIVTAACETAAGDAVARTAR